MLPFYVSLFAFVAVLFATITSGLILSKREQSRHALTWYMVGCNTFVSMWVILTYFQLSTYTAELNPKIYALMSLSSNFGVLLGMVFLHSFVNLLVYPRLNTKRLIFLSSLSAVILGLKLAMVYEVFSGTSEFIDENLLYSSMVNLIILVNLIYFIRKDFSVLMAEDLTEIQRKQVTSLSRSINIALGGIIPIIGIAEFYDRSLLSLAFIVIAVAMFFAARAYVYDVRVAFILPEKLYLALVVNKGGVYRFKRDFSNTGEIHDAKVGLISSAFSAVAALMSEFYDRKVNPKLIEFEGQLILISWQLDYFFVVFSERDSSMIRRAMDRTVQEVNRHFGEDLEFHMNGSQSLDLNAIIDETFYFVYN